MERTPSVKACRLCQLPRGGSLWHSGKVSGSSAMLAGVPAPPGGAVAQRLRGFESAEPEKTVKRSSRRTGVNLQFFPVELTSLGLKGASSPFFVAPARRNRWWFSGSLLPPKENIPRLPPPTPQRCNCRFFSTLSVKNTLCKKLTGKLRRTSRLTDTKVFFITAKDPARGSTPRCGGTSAPRREPWRWDAGRPDPPPGPLRARWGRS